MPKPGYCFTKCAAGLGSAKHPREVMAEGSSGVRTRRHTLSGLDNGYCLTALEARRPRSRFWWIWFLERLSFWLVDGHFLTVSMHGLISARAEESSGVLSFLKGHQSCCIKIPPLRSHLTFITSSQAKPAASRVRASAGFCSGHTSVCNKPRVCDTGVSGRPRNRPALLFPILASPRVSAGPSKFPHVPSKHVMWGLVAFRPGHCRVVTCHP